MFPQIPPSKVNPWTGARTNVRRRDLLTPPPFANESFKAAYGISCADHAFAQAFLTLEVTNLLTSRLGTDTNWLTIADGYVWCNGNRRRSETSIRNAPPNGLTDLDTSFRFLLDVLASVPPGVWQPSVGGSSGRPGVPTGQKLKGVGDE
jgi:hypothetical protein